MQRAKVYLCLRQIYVAKRKLGCRLLSLVLACFSNEFSRGKKWGSRNLVGIAIQLSDSEQEKLLVGYSMLISPEKFDFGIE